MASSARGYSGNVTATTEINISVVGKGRNLRIGGHDQIMSLQIDNPASTDATRFISIPAATTETPYWEMLEVNFQTLKLLRAITTVANIWWW